MATTYTLISSNTLSSSAASVTFSSIPSTYTDLVVKASVRTDQATNNALVRIKLNATTSGYSWTYLEGYGTTAASGRYSNQTIFDALLAEASGTSVTANTFSSFDVYIPNYTTSAAKPISVYSVVEDNSTANNDIISGAAFWNNAAAVTDITLTPTPTKNFVSGSSFYLYGISKN